MIELMFWKQSSMRQWNLSSCMIPSLVNPLSVCAERIVGHPLPFILVSQGSTKPSSQPSDHCCLLFSVGSGSTVGRIGWGIQHRGTFTDWVRAIFHPLLIRIEHHMHPDNILGGGSTSTVHWGARPKGDGNQLP
jgi:hypothetical protein